ncbi:MAG: MotA/TolQ/ExbB proton channel family protein [Gammaproteobacteria bacterium]|nr:MotA/TolQ/ExbB proton channel family protein [Gammaproteobacteria bacterium]
MWETVQSGGWLMAPILLGSVVAAAIVIERAWTLRRRRVVPEGLVQQVAARLGADAAALADIDGGSPLAQVIAAGAGSAHRGREHMQAAMQEAVDRANHDLQRYLTTLGIIASVTPLLGLLGTVVGMIEVFSALMLAGAGNAQALAGGIAEALITTAAGLSVAIPALMFHRYFLRRVDDLALEMEQEAARLADLVGGDAESRMAQGADP